MVKSCSEEQKEQLKKYKVLKYTPFDPVGKKTAAKVQSPDGEILHTAKGAPQVILNLAENADEIRARVLEVRTAGMTMTMFIIVISD
jgi:H+-transporting ATPase